jgi:hypothetical protein
MGRLARLAFKLLNKTRANLSRVPLLALIVFLLVSPRTRAVRA